MTPETFLSRLAGVREIRPGRWVALCPAHEDKSPSLSVTTKEADGSPLFHCHAGCHPDDILIALDMTWGDLYPDRWQEAKARALAHGHKRLQKMLSEITQVDYARHVLLLAAADQRQGKAHDLWDRSALALAVDIMEEDRAHG